ncbi:MAG: hypothetical protein LBT97_11945, partial [Planctomycetota bacterium]|nr:hypothetical protein [Planctomycetota bacterium]
PPARAERTWGEVASDTGRGVVKGIGSTAKGIGWLFDADSLQKWGGEVEEGWGAKQSEALKAQLESVDRAEGFAGTIAALWDNPAAIGDYIATSLPAMVPGMGVGGVGAKVITGIARQAATKAALAAGASESVALRAGSVAAARAGTRATRFAIGANMLGEGAVSAGITGAEVEEFATEHGATPEEARAAANKSALVAGALTTAGAGIGAGLETRAMLGQLTDKGAKGFAKNVGREAFEEAVQNPGEEYASYLGKSQFDPAQTFDPGKAIATGLVAGGGMGAGFHAGGRALNYGKSELEQRLQDRGLAAEIRARDAGNDLANATNVSQMVEAAGRLADAEGLGIEEETPSPASTRNEDAFLARLNELDLVAEERPLTRSEANERAALSAALSLIDDFSTPTEGDRYGLETGQAQQAKTQGRQRQQTPGEINAAFSESDIPVGRVDPAVDSVRPAVDSVRGDGVPDLALRELDSLVQRPPAGESVLQNRSRSTAASVQQMNAIAGAPDYQRLSWSRDFGNGAPVVAGGEIPDNQRGKTDTAVASDGRRISVQYAIVEANHVLASHQFDGTPNSGYGPSHPGLLAIAGNGRIAGLQQAYRQGTAGRYTAELIGDTSLTGIDPAVVATMKRPVLVRLMSREDVSNDIGDVSNTVANLVLSPVEQAWNDARRIDLSSLAFNEDGAVAPATVRQFVISMPLQEQGGLLDANGQPAKQAVDRLNAAIFAQGYDNDELVRLYAQAQDMEAINALNALAQAAPQMMRLEGLGSFDIRQAVVDAVSIVVNARRHGMTLEEASRQTDVNFDPLAGRVVAFFAHNIRSRKRLAEGLRRLAETAYNEATRPESDMFGQTPPKMTREEIVATLEGNDDGQVDKAGLEHPARVEPLREDAGRGGTDQ